MGWMIQSLNSVRVIDFYILYNVQTSSGVPAISYSVCTGVFSWG